MTRGFKKLNENATIPERATEHSKASTLPSSSTFANKAKALE